MRVVQGRTANALRAGNAIGRAPKKISENRTLETGQLFGR
jgi:hypothetical protein